MKPIFFFFEMWWEKRVKIFRTLGFELTLWTSKSTKAQQQRMSSDVRLWVSPSHKNMSYYLDSLHSFLGSPQSFGVPVHLSRSSPYIEELRCVPMKLSFRESFRWIRLSSQDFRVEVGLAAPMFIGSPNTGVRLHTDFFGWARNFLVGFCLFRCWSGVVAG